VTGIQALDAGAIGYVLKDRSDTELLSAVRHAIEDARPAAALGGSDRGAKTIPPRRCG
jgi:DNA-binding NarL/FixJ family response regulator